MRGQPWVSRAACALVLCGVALAWARGLDRPFGSGDEVIYAQNVREMRATGELGTLSWQGVDVLQRPPAPFWPAAATAGIVEGEAGLRLPAAVVSFATLLLLFFAASRFWGRVEAGLLAVLLCAGAPSFHLFARALLSDPFLVVAATAALVGTMWAQRDRRGLLVAAAGLGLAFAFKSLAAAIPAVALAPWLAVAARAHGDRRTILWAAATFVALAAPYYVAGFLEHGGRFWDEHIGYSLWARARGELAVGMSEPTAYLSYLISADREALAWMSVGTLAALVLGVRRRDRLLLIPAAYAACVLALLSVVGTRLPHYLLPIYPACALAAAGVYSALIPEIERYLDDTRKVLVKVAVVAFAVLGMLRGISELPEGHFLPDPAAHVLGRAAADVARPGETVYTLEWYAPAFGYYAGRDLVMTTASPRLFGIIDDVDFLRAAGAAALVPPAAPLPASLAGEILVAGPTEALAAAPWLTEVTPVAGYPAAASTPLVTLVRARVVR